MRRFIITVNPFVTLSSLYLLTLGILSVSLTYVYPNNNEELPDCMILNGSLHFWLGNLSYILMAYGGFGLVSGGLIAIVLFRMGLVEEGGCLAHVFHGTCGKVIRTILFLILVIYLIIGLSIIDNHRKVQFKDILDADTYCDKTFYSLTVTIACLISISLISYTIYIIYKLIKKIKKNSNPNRNERTKESTTRVRIENELGIVRVK